MTFGVESARAAGRTSPEPVDLGLSVLWGDQNIVDQYFRTKYYYWGGGNGLTLVGTDEEYPDNICGTQYDVATQLYGDGWRMPTADEFKELYEKCSSQFNSDGVKFTASNGNSITLGLVGYKKNGEDASDYSYYWTGTKGNPGIWNSYITYTSHDPNVPNQSYQKYAPDAFGFNSSGLKDASKVCNYLFSNEYQCAIRPVKDKTGGTAIAAYAVLNNGTLTFYYDNSRDSRPGTKYDVEASYSSSKLPGWASDSLSIKKAVFDSSFAGYSPTSTAYWFGGHYNNLTTISNLTYLNTSEVTNMRGMFYFCKSLTELDLSRFNTANVTDMTFMFAGCESLKSLEVSFFNTSKVTSMGSMFTNCSQLTTLELRNFDTSNVTDMGWMFYGCKALTQLDISTFDTSKVTQMRCMFYDCTSVEELDVSGFNTENVTDMGWMFTRCGKIKSLYVTGFYTSKVTDMYAMFYSCTSLTTIYAKSGTWDTGKVTNSGIMFGNCTSLVGGAGTMFNSSHIEKDYAHIDSGNSNPGYFTNLAPALPSGTIAYAVYNNKVLTFYYDNKSASRTGTKYEVKASYSRANKPRWILDYYRRTFTKAVFDASFANYKPTCTAYWFYECSAMTTIEGISNLNTSQVTTMAEMFRFCNVLNNLDLHTFNTSNVTDMQCMFCYCFKLSNLNISGFNTAKVTNMSHMFHCCPMESLDVSSFNTSNVTDMSIMFAGCKNLKTLDLKNFNTAKVVDMSWMFLSCENTKDIIVSSFNTSNVESMYGMFAQCYQLSELNLKSFNTAKVSNMSLMFYYCKNLKTIYAKRGLWSNQNVANNETMFIHCVSLVGGCGTKFDKQHVGKDYAIIDEGESNPGYLTDPLSAYVVFKDETITFYYDDKRDEREGESYLVAKTLFEGPGNVASWPQLWTIVHKEDIIHARFDPSFADYHVDKYHLRLFDGLSNMQDITEIEYFSIDNITDLSGLFSGCSSLKSLDLSSFNTAHITSMNRMFQGCSSLKTIYVGGRWLTKGLKEYGGDQMFNNCTNLVGGAGTKFDASHTDYTYAHIDGGPSNPGYFTYKSSESVTISSALVAGYSSNHNLNFTNTSGLSAWTATGFRGGNIQLSRVYSIPAGTGVYLKADKAGTYTIPTTMEDSYYVNMFVGTPTRTTVEPTVFINGEEFTTLSFAISKTTGKPAFFPNTSEKTYANNKMYLQMPSWVLAGSSSTRELAVGTHTSNEPTASTGQKVNVKVGNACVAGFSSNENLDFTTVKGLSAWTATGFRDGNILLSRVYAVPAGTGVYVKAEKSGTYSIPVTTEVPYYVNMFVGVPNGATVGQYETINGEQFATLSFALSKTTGKPAFFPNTSSKTYDPGKMYLRLPSRLLTDDSQARLVGIIFEDDAELTGINEVVEGIHHGQADNKSVYNLSGQRLAAPRKGLNIVGGKKVVVK